uniref:Cysteine sulfinic acid decarboxylase n=1 Tax=Astyanax mexicanus TaxID=7994 RepID=A0A8B9KGZ0_ASTMX
MIWNWIFHMFICFSSNLSECNMSNGVNGDHHGPEPDQAELSRSEGELFLSEAFKIIVEEAVHKATDVKEKVCEWKDPEELRALMDLELGEHGESQQQLLKRVRDVAKYSVKTNHPRFFNQLFSGVDYHALTGRLLTETLNTSQYTYEVAPVFVLMEDVVLRKLRSLVGWSEGDGIFCPGGSVSNMYAMNIARYWAFPQVKTQGLWAVPRLAVFTSQESHYSMKKSAAFLGIGTENIYHVKVDESGRMIPEDLEAKIVHAKSQDAVPFFVNATAGTTVQGAFDPLNRIADISERNGMWMHVDVRLAHTFITYSSLRLNIIYIFIFLIVFIILYLNVVLKYIKIHVFDSPQPQFVNVCFWFIPPSLRGKENSADYQDKLAKVAPLIKERMVKKGSMMVGYQPLDSRVNFFRMVILSPQLTHSDLDFFLNETERLGEDL